MNKWKMAALFAIALLLALAVQAPAWLLTIGVNQASEGRLELRDVTGTLWKGSGTLRLRDERIEFERVNWKVLPQALVLLQLSILVDIDDKDLSGRGNVVLGRTSIDFREVGIDLPASTVSTLFPQAAVLSPAGRVTVNIYELECPRGICDGGFSLEWKDAALGISELRPLGDYLLTGPVDKNKFDYQLKTMKGTLRAAGRGTWEPGKRPTFTGEVSAPPDQLPKVQGLLRLLGTPDERGVVRISR